MPTPILPTTTVTLRGPTTTMFTLLRNAATMEWREENTSDRSEPQWLAEHHPEMVHALANWLRCNTTGVPETMRVASWVRVEKYLLRNLVETGSTPD